MTMGEYIRKLRMGDNKFGHKWSQEELGHKLNPPVNRGAVNKWEKGRVTNIRKEHIEQLAEIFGVHPIDLMCFSEKYNEKQISEEVETIEAVQKLFGRQAVQILDFFCQLNDLGKEKLLNNAGDLAELPKYTNKEYGSRGSR